MRRFVLALAVAVLAGSAYVAMPFISAWNIREAIRHGDAAYLADKIVWPSFKESLKPSLARMALDMPLDPGAMPATKPTLWQRFKQSWGRGLVDRAVEGYVTPEGLSQLFSLRKTYRNTVNAGADPDLGKPLLQRAKAFWSRVKRAEFTSPTRLELDVVDKNEPTRMFAGVLELRGIDWKLTELRIRDSGGANTSAPGVSESSMLGGDTTSEPATTASVPSEGPLER